MVLVFLVQDPKCVNEGETGVLIGVAFDGYPIYRDVNEDGSTIMAADLDKCGGREVNGAYR